MCLDYIKEFKTIEKRSTGKGHYRGELNINVSYLGAFIIFISLILKERKINSSKKVFILLLYKFKGHVRKKVVYSIV